MDKPIFIDENLDSYKTFLDYDWTRRIGKQAEQTPLEEIIFDLLMAWKGAANTHYMPWLTVHTMVAAALGAAKDHAFPARFTAALAERLSQKMEGVLRNMGKRKLVSAIQEIAQEVRAVDEQPPDFEIETVWRTMLAQSEFRLSIWGAQRLCYGAVYYAYEDFLARCYRLSTGDSSYRIAPGFSQDFRVQYGEMLRDYCWSDHKVNIARLTRHALIHNGGRLTSDLQKHKHGLRLLGEDIQIVPSYTKDLYELLKDRVTRFLNDPKSPLAKSP